MIIDDQTLQALDTKLGFEGMQDEVKNVEACSTSVLMSEAEAQAIKKVDSKARSVAARWVCAHKSDTRVRCRIVGRDLADSSPTPSAEALHLLLIMAATYNMFLRSLDIAHLCVVHWMSSRQSFFDFLCPSPWKMAVWHV